MAVRARQCEEDYQELSNRFLLLQDEERRRLAIALHDSTAQCLAALMMNLDLLARNNFEGIDVQLRRALKDSRRLAKNCSQEVRTLAYLLHTPVLEEAGLLSAVRAYVEGFIKRSGILVHMDLHEIAPLPRPLEMALFRVVQESLTSVHRHASSATASIRLKNVSRAVVLEIHDRGRALRNELKQQDSTRSPQNVGVGIQGMRERIRQLGGTFGVAFTASGTTVRVTVPAKDA